MHNNIKNIESDLFVWFKIDKNLRYQCTSNPFTYSWIGAMETIGCFLSKIIRDNEKVNIFIYNDYKTKR
jgi:hypothetical protein